MNIMGFKPIILLLGISVNLITCQASEKPTTDHSRPQLKIMTYNVFYGFNHHKKTKEGADWINKQNVDVLALQELSNYTQPKLESLALQWKHKHAALLVGTGYPLGLTAKTPIETIEKRAKKPRFLHCKTAGIHFFVVHQSIGLRNQAKYVGVILKKIETLLSEKKHVIVLGDFNSVSATDKIFLDKKSELLAYEKKRENLKDGKLDYSIMERYKKSGLVDVCDKFLPNKDEQRFTFSTKKKYILLTRRIDFILLDSTLAKTCTHALIPREKILFSISDHFPVIITLGKP